MGFRVYVSSLGCRFIGFRVYGFVFNVLDLVLRFLVFGFYGFCVWG